MDEVRAALGNPSSVLRRSGTLDGKSTLFDTVWDFEQIGHFVRFTTSFLDSKLVLVEVRRDLLTRRIVFALTANGPRESADFDRLYCQ